MSNKSKENKSSKIEEINRYDDEILHVLNIIVQHLDKFNTLHPQITTLHQSQEQLSTLHLSNQSNLQESILSLEAKINKLLENQEQILSLDSKINKLQENQERILSLETQLSKLQENQDKVISICEKLHLRLIQNDEREINRRIREFTISPRNKDPIRFVPTVSTVTKSLGFLSSLTSK